MGTFDSLNFNNPFLQTNQFPMPNFSSADTTGFTAFTNPSAISFGGNASTPWSATQTPSAGGFNPLSTPWGNSQTSFGGGDFMNSAFSSPWGNSFKGFGGGFNPFEDMMSMMLGNPFARLDSGCGTYVIDPKKAESQYSPMIEKYAKEYGIRADVAKALVRQESRFNPNAVSKAGAKGLTQLMPGTAKDLGVTNPFDPEQSIKGGMKYLAQLLKHYNGDYRKAVAAYNGGIGNVDRKGINFCAETSNYHKAILG